MIERYVFNKDIKIKSNVSCIGSFDGVHRGHQELIKKTTELYKKGVIINKQRMIVKL